MVSRRSSDISVLTLTSFVFVELFRQCLGIHCFECYSLDGSNKDCEDEFGPYNQTGYLLRRKCEVGYLGFEAFYCIKIKGTRYDGQTVVIRTCSVDDWGSQCGDIFFEQNDVIARMSGCLASCNFDGCNTTGSLDASVSRNRITVLAAVFCVSAFHAYMGLH